MIEVLVSIVVLTLGLLGLAGLQARLQVSEMEAYQRSQALILVNDMVSRLAANGRNATDYVNAATTTSPLGAGMSCPTVQNTRAQIDISEWCNALQGAAETSGTSKVGALIGGRGCIESIATREYMVSVAWQGYVPIPPRAVAAGGVSPPCASGLYDSTDTGQPCSVTTLTPTDSCRRIVTMLVRIPSL